MNAVVFKTVLTEISATGLSVLIYKMRELDSNIF